MLGAGAGVIPAGQSPRHQGRPVRYRVHYIDNFGKRRVTPYTGGCPKARRGVRTSMQLTA
jgi:hypothetical protein